MQDNETQVRELIERWVTAVHAGDLEAVLVDHASDIVMFDVPPPNEGVRGVDAYGETWPPFFEWQASGACFELVSLDVTAGDDVAFAYCLLRCGTPDELANDPDNRLRLTIGLRKQDGRWVVTHEHHSFPDRSQGVADRGEREVRQLHERWFEATASRDIEATMSAIADDIVSYEHEAPLQYVGADDVRAVCQRGFDSATGELAWSVPDLVVVASEDLVVSWGLNQVGVTDADGNTEESWSRGTRVFSKVRGEWSMIHQHVSYPYDPADGTARTDLTG